MRTCHPQASRPPTEGLGLTESLESVIASRREAARYSNVSLDPGFALGLPTLSRAAPPARSDHVARSRTRSQCRSAGYVEAPGLGTDFMSLQDQAQPPAPSRRICSPPCRVPRVRRMSGQRGELAPAFSRCAPARMPVGEWFPSWRGMLVGLLVGSLQRDHHCPRRGPDRGVFEGRPVLERVRRDAPEALNQLEVLEAALQPCLRRVVGGGDDQRVAFEAAA